MIVAMTVGAHADGPFKPAKSRFKGIRFNSKKIVSKAGSQVLMYVLVKVLEITNNASGLFLSLEFGCGRIQVLTKGY
jgi:hypothetical protein